jgi:hypothetical protein
MAGDGVVEDDVFTIKAKEESKIRLVCHPP